MDMYFGDEAEHLSFASEGSFANAVGECKNDRCRRREYEKELLETGATKEFAKRRALEKFPKSVTVSDGADLLKTLWDNTKKGLGSGSGGNTEAKVVQVDDSDSGSPEAPSSFWGKHGTKVLIGGGLLVVVGGVLFALKRS